jgi:hypothetical protein
VAALNSRHLRTAAVSDWRAVNLMPTKQVSGSPSNIVVMTPPDGWEYRTLQPPRKETKKEAEDPTERLNDLGADGWELVSTVEYVGGGTKFLVLKRPVDAAVDEDG